MGIKFVASVSNEGEAQDGFMMIESEKHCENIYML